MTILRIFEVESPNKALKVLSGENEIADNLKDVGVRFERWLLNKQLSNDASNEDITAAYQEEINKLVKETGYQSFDVINMTSDNPQKESLRSKFFAEHVHSEDEIRFFVRGKGLFSMRIDNRVYEVVCEKDDLISVPAGTPHWFDMGESPSFTCIRLFDSPDGWIANYTGSEIAKSFSRLDD